MVNFQWYAAVERYIFVWLCYRCQKWTRPTLYEDPDFAIVEWMSMMSSLWSCLSSVIREVKLLYRVWRCIYVHTRLVRLTEGRGQVIFSCAGLFRSHSHCQGQSHYDVFCFLRLLSLFLQIFFLNFLESIFLLLYFFRHFLQIVCEVHLSLFIVSPLYTYSGNKPKSCFVNEDLNYKREKKKKIFVTFPPKRRSY